MEKSEFHFYPNPKFRRLRGYAFDPSISLKLDTSSVNLVEYKIKWEKIEVGPVGEYIEVIDFDPTIGQFYKAVDLDHPNVLSQHGLDPSESNPLFHQQMVYAVSMTTIERFEKALGRKILWSSRLLNRDKGNPEYAQYVKCLRIYPHAIRDANAYYSPQKKAILFGYFLANPIEDSIMMPGSMVFTCLSHDIIAHEVTHAILDGMHRSYSEATNPDVLAFHEAFADIVALFQHFTFPDVLAHQISKTRGDLLNENLLAQLANQFGDAIGFYGSLRDAIGKVNVKTKKWEAHQPSPMDYLTVFEPHKRGSILVAAIFEAFNNIYRLRVADLLRIASNGSGILPLGEIHPDLVKRLSIEASKTASHIMNMCIRALDYCPPVDITFGDYLRAIITADLELVPEDPYNYRLSFIDAFRRRGIYPNGIKNLSNESLRHPIHENLGKSGQGIDSDSDDLFRIIAEFLTDYADAIKYTSNRKEIYEITKDYISGKYEDEDGIDLESKKRILGLHRRIEVKFNKSPEFSKLTGLVFGSDYHLLGIKTSKKGNYKGAAFQIQNLRLVSRTGPDGNQLNQVVFSIIQTSRYKIVDGSFLPIPSDESESKNHSLFRGGCTLIFDLDSKKLKYAISKPLIGFGEIFSDNYKIDEKRLKAEYDFQSDMVEKVESEYSRYFGSKEAKLNEPFSFLHQH
ncbi:hypothetical protein J0A67_04820 [Algoriphagus aestuariicola]|uniref:Peptidase M4 n=1 Tax=Algoriphagus aestuariicola TaxID=1852016 RepID=A0ABS3BLJ3_9BACT|nr:hypothetical protein [Algoriphagus aestuariicola]MBN7800171.1 hypothetical protein [Algoriphagus aestuariicola]